MKWAGHKSDTNFHAITPRDHLQLDHYFSKETIFHLSRLLAEDSWDFPSKGQGNPNVFKCTSTTLTTMHRVMPNLPRAMEKATGGSCGQYARTDEVCTLCGMHLVWYTLECVDL